MFSLFDKGTWHHVNSARTEIQACFISQTKKVMKQLTAVRKTLLKAPQHDESTYISGGTCGATEAGEDSHVPQIVLVLK